MAIDAERRKKSSHRFSDSRTLYENLIWSRSAPPSRLASSGTVNEPKNKNHTLAIAFDKRYKSKDPRVLVLPDGFNFDGTYFSLYSDLPAEARRLLVQKRHGTE